MTEQAPAQTPVKYKRVLLKLSGESLMGPDAFGINRETIQSTVEDIKEAYDMGVQIGIVVGGGNIFRGVALGSTGMERTQGDHMGMLATLMNALALQDALRKNGVEARVQSALSIERIAETYIRGKALRHLEKGRIVIFAAGTGNPYFTTDTTAALRGAEIGAEVVLKATKVDGIYSADPMKDPNATFFKSITFDEAMKRDLKVMDATAFALCREQNLPIKVFNIRKKGSIARVCRGEDEGTLVYNPQKIRYSTTGVFMSISEIQQQTEYKMKRTVETLREDFIKIRTGRASTGLLDHIMVEYYGTPTPINQVAQIGGADARTLTVQPWEKSMVAPVEKAIRSSDLGLNPATSGMLIRVPLPPLTEERRRELTKFVRHLGEEAKVAIRNLRRDANEQVKKLTKAKEISEDDESRAEKDIQKLTDNFVANIDQCVAEKEKEVMTV